MKHTVKLSALHAIALDQDGEQLTVELRVGGIAIHKQPITPEQSTMLSNAFGFAAMDAQAVRAQRAEAVRMAAAAGA